MEQVAVVTGGARGIGRMYAMTLAEAGMAVVVADLNEIGIAETVSLIAKGGGQAIGVVTDVSDAASTTRLGERVEQEFGAAHVLVNNAALMTNIPYPSLLEMPIDLWQRVFRVNLEGALLCTQAIAPLMKAAGWGRIINQSSTSAYMGGGSHYSCSKLALIGLTQGLAKELGDSGITVNAIAPGPIMTEAMAGAAEAGSLDRLIAAQAIPRRGQPSDLAGIIRFLVSDDSGWLTGQTLIVDAGGIKRL